jgi:hypothetical protein
VGNEGDNEQYQEQEKQDFRYAGGEQSNPRKTENGSQNRYQQKQQGPIKHVDPPFVAAD